MADSRQPVDFDEWQLLASSDPEGFEAARRRLLEAAIARAPEKRRQRLQALQWRVDRVRERAATPLAACISLSDMMWEAVAGENGLLEALHGGCHTRKPRLPRRAVVIPLRRDRPGQV
jgi:hypothetical protein